MKARYVCNLLLASGLMLASGLAQSVVITYFNNLADWEAAAGSSAYSEQFNGNATDPAIIFSSTNGSGSIVNNRWQDQVNNDSTANTYIDFSQLTGGFGGHWNTLAPGGPGTGISLTLTFFNGVTQTLSQQVSNSLDNDFFGFMSDVGISRIALSEGSQSSGVETYWLDYAVYSDIPEPESLALLGIGLVALSLLRRKQNKSST